MVYGREIYLPPPYPMKSILVGNPRLMKDINKATILNAIRTKGPISRVGISQLVKLSGTTISVIVDDLLKDGFIYEVGTDESTGGRKPILLELNPLAGYSIGIDLGETDSLFGAIVNLKGEFIESRRKSIGPSPNIDTIVSSIKDTIRELISNMAVDPEKLLGIGIGIPALVDIRTGIVHSASNLGIWNDLPLKTIIEEEFGITTYIDDSVKARAQGERWRINGDVIRDNLLYVTVGKGIGAAIIADGKIYRGEDSIAGEFGHITVDLNGPRCSCGNRGCLEAMASEGALVRMAMDRLQTGVATTLTPEILKSVGVQAIIDAARSGDRFAIELIRGATVILAAGIGSAINLLNPAVVVMSGTMIQKAWDLILEPLKQELTCRTLETPYEKVKIIRAGLEGEKTAVGPALLVLQEFFNYPVDSSTD